MHKNITNESKLEARTNDVLPKKMCWSGSSWSLLVSLLVGKTNRNQITRNYFQYLFIIWTSIDEICLIFKANFVSRQATVHTLHWRFTCNSIWPMAVRLNHSRNSVADNATRPIERGTRINVQCRRREFLDSTRQVVELYNLAINWGF